MYLKNVSIRNFRNYEKVDLEFSKNVNIFIGNNAQGKTNLLESIYVLAITKSHRNHIDNNLIKENQLFTKIKGKVEKANTTNEFELILNSKGKAVKINNNPIKKISEYISNFTVIIFCPDDLDLVKGSPSIRRKFMNIEIAQINKKYLRVLSEYNNLLKTRNEYLKQIDKTNIDKVYFEVLTDQLIEKGVRLYLYRNEFIKKVDVESNKINEELSKNTTLQIVYKPNIEIEKYDSELIKQKMKKKFIENASREIFQKTTLYGPHRDDFEIYIDKKNIKNYGSQGQQRLAILSMKFSEINIFIKETKEKPILLLDDIFSELDENKKNNIIKYIDRNIQTFITTTDLENIDKKILKKAKIYEIIDANIKTFK